MDFHGRRNADVEENPSNRATLTARHKFTLSTITHVRIEEPCVFVLSSATPNDLFVFSSLRNIIVSFNGF